MLVFHPTVFAYGKPFTGRLQGFFTDLATLAGLQAFGRVFMRSNHRAVPRDVFPARFIAVIGGGPSRQRQPQTSQQSARHNAPFIHAYSPKTICQQVKAHTKDHATSTPHPATAAITATPAATAGSAPLLGAPEPAQHQQGFLRLQHRAYQPCQAVAGVPLE